LSGGYGGGYGALTGGDGAYYEGNADGGAGQFAALAARTPPSSQAIHQQQQADFAAQQAAAQAAANAQVNSYNPATQRRAATATSRPQQYQPQFGTGIGASPGIGNGYF
jgi:hypothetical protein